jgi:hypothetical protein
MRSTSTAGFGHPVADILGDPCLRAIDCALERPDDLPLPARQRQCHRRGQSANARQYEALSITLKHAAPTNASPRWIYLAIRTLRRCQSLLLERLRKT